MSCLGDDLATPIDNPHNGPNLLALGACTKVKKTWRADFFTETDDILPSRLVIIFADSEDEAEDRAVTQIGDAVRVEFIRMISRGN